MRVIRGWFGALAALLLAAPALAQVSDPGWPREVTRGEAKAVMYQPQVDAWKDFRSLQWRAAVEIVPAKGARPIVGAVGMHADTLVDSEGHAVLLANLKVTRTNFPGLDEAAAAQAAQLFATFVPETTTISLHRIVASTPKPESAPAVAVKNDPPAIFVATGPAVLVFVDGKPVLGRIGDTPLQFVVNTHLPVVFDAAGGRYYLLAGDQWMSAAGLAGPWSLAPRLPAGMDKVAADPQWSELAAFVPPKQEPGKAAPRVFYSEAPAEVIRFDGKPDFRRIAGTGLLYAANTESAVLMHAATKQFYYLSAGRWFRAESLDGPWRYASADLPADFAALPPASPAGRLRASVPGTEEAKDAVLMAQIPTTLVVSPDAAAKVKVAYDGDPRFAPVPGTSLQYAVNTADKVIRAGDAYYLCLQGVWFLSTSAQGPWQVAKAVPQEIYAIPPGSPVYNVTYVTQVTTPTGAVQSSYTAGYMGAFIVGTAVGYTVAYGSGYYHPPYVYYPPAGYPVYHPYPMPYGAPVYNTATGAYGWGQAAYGPHGGAARAATYNPYTGTYAKGATAYGPYGSRSAAQAYNPYTGTYAATAQGSSPTAQWGSSVVTRGNQAAYAQHTTTAAGTAGSIQTASGGKMAGVSGAGGTSAAVGRTAGGDMYASKDGNVYRNTGSGWQSYSNGSWNSVQKPSPSSSGYQAQAQQRAQGGGGFEGVQHEAQSRERGSFQSHEFERSRSGGGFSRGGGFGRRR